MLCTILFDRSIRLIFPPLSGFSEARYVIKMNDHVFNYKGDSDEAQEMKYQDIAQGVACNATLGHSNFFQLYFLPLSYRLIRILSSFYNSSSTTYLVHWTKRRCLCRNVLLRKKYSEC